MTVWKDADIDWYAENYGEDPTTRMVADAAPLGKDDDVLDVGCGTGASLRHLRNRGASGRLVGVDPFPRMIGHARSQSEATGISYQVAPGEDLPFADAEFDGMLCVNAFQHFEDRRAAMQEVARVLKPGGWLVLDGESFENEFWPESTEFTALLTSAGLGKPEVEFNTLGFVCSTRKDG